MPFVPRSPQTKQHEAEVEALAQAVTALCTRKTPPSSQDLKEICAQYTRVAALPNLSSDNKESLELISETIENVCNAQLAETARCKDGQLLDRVYDILEGHIPVAARLEELRAKHPFTKEDMNFYVAAHGEIVVERLPAFAKFLEKKRQSRSSSPPARKATVQDRSGGA